MASKLPVEIQYAKEIITSLATQLPKDDIARLKKTLPAFAMHTKKSGKKVTKTFLKKAVEELIANKTGKFKKLHKKSYQDIVNSFKKKAGPVSKLISNNDWSGLHGIYETTTDSDLALYLLRDGQVDAAQRMYEERKYIVDYEEYSKAAELCAEDLIKSYLAGDTFNSDQAVDPINSIASTVADFATDAKLYKMLVEEYGAETKYQNAYALRNAAKNNNVVLVTYLLDKRTINSYRRNSERLEAFINDISNDDCHEVLDVVLKHFKLPSLLPQRWVSRYNLSRPNCHNSAYVILNSLSADDRSELLDRAKENFPEAYERIVTLRDQINHWKKVTGRLPPRDNQKLSPYYFKEKAFNAAHEILKKEMHQDSAQCQFYAYQISSLLRTEDRILQYLEKWGQEGKQPLHDIIHDIKFPKSGRIDIKAWGDAVLQHGPKMARLVNFADKIKQPARGKNGRSYSLIETRKLASQAAYDGAETHPKLAELCFQVHYGQEGFDKAVKQVEEYQKRTAANDNEASRIPDLSVKGDQFGMPGSKFRKLADGDMKGLLLGAFTSCCQHIDGVGAECAEHGFQSSDSGFYVLEDSKGKIIGQAWAWRGEKDELVLDSLESKKGRVSDDSWRTLVDVIEKEIRENSNDITAFHIGSGGNTPALHHHSLLAGETAQPKNYLGYRDSGYQYQIKNLIKI